MAFKLTVNGREQAIDADGDTPLLYVLRNELGLKGTRFGCGGGLCGACTVLIEDRPAYACDTPLWAAESRRVTTVEGLLDDGALGSVQTALVEARAGQCGYCLSGVTMRIEGALRAQPPLSRREIVDELAKNLCRCGTHPRILRALDALLAARAPESVA